MSDYREDFLTEVKNSMIAGGYDPSTIADLERILITSLSGFEMSERTTQLIVQDTSTEELLGLYAGSILTEGKSKKTVKLYCRVLMRFYRFIHKPLLSVNAFDVRVWLASIQSTASLRTVENYRSYLSAFYQWLQREDMIEKNPMSKILPVQYEQVVRLPFSDVEIDALRSGCATLRERAELELMLASGARVSEVAALNRSDIKLTDLTVVIREGKGNKQRETFLNDVARTHLIKYLKTRNDDNEALFQSKGGGRISSRAIADDLKRIGKRAEVENVHPHRCRRTFASSLARKGMSLRTIQVLMGHSDINTTMDYITFDAYHVKNEYMRYA